MKRKCGKCEILGYPDFSLFFEYKNPLEEENKIIDARDILTSTPLKPIEEIDGMNVKQGELIMNHFEEVERCEMMEYLKHMTRDEVAEYFNKVNEMKINYLEKINDKNQLLLK